MPKVMAGSVTNHQMIFIRFTVAVLIDLTVLNLFNEFWKHVYIDSFSISLFVALLLQVMLQMSIVLEHRLANHFKKSRIKRFFSSWAVLFFSKIIILEALNIAFGNKILFTGPFNGLVSFIVVVFAILIAEQIIIRIYYKLA